VSAGNPLDLRHFKVTIDNDDGSDSPKKAAAECGTASDAPRILRCNGCGLCLPLFVFVAACSALCNL
jgi:hypothetical protein